MARFWTSLTTVETDVKRNWKTHGVYLIIMAGMTLACERIEFSSDKKTKGNSRGAETYGDALGSNAKDPIDFTKRNRTGEGDNGEDGTIGDGQNGNLPTPGTGDTLIRNFELGCEEGQGAIIEVSGDREFSLALLGPGESPTQSDNPGQNDKDSGGNPDQNEDPSGENDQDDNPKGEDDEGTPKKKEDVEGDDPKIGSTVKGRFCPTSKDSSVKILFVVDYSGSMGRHTLFQNSEANPEGNDPLNGTSCGRLEAATALLSSLEASANVEVGMLPFAGGVVTDYLVPMEPLATFQAKLNADTFCRHVIVDQDNRAGGPGSMSHPVGGLTNYKAAFNQAQTMLANVYGRKALYFITDGEPTVGGEEPGIASATAAGVTAGIQMREAVDNLVMNALILGNNPSAASVLEQITGTSERVRRAANASDLAEEIQNFPNPVLQVETAEATFSVEPYGTTDLGLQSFEEDPNNPLEWRYQTQPFYLHGIIGQTVDNVVLVTVEDQYGDVFESRVTIRYTR